MRKPKLRATLQDRREPALRVERNPAVLVVFRVLSSDQDLMLRSIDVSILDAKHLTLSAAFFQRADDAIVHPARRLLQRLHWKFSE
jgi:hypothetical protein